MLWIKSPKLEKPDIHPLSMEEVKIFLDNVQVRYNNFFVVAFFSGMRFGEMAALKWKNVDFKLGVIKVRETRVRGEEGMIKKTEDGNQRTDDSPAFRCHWIFAFSDR